MIEPDTLVEDLVTEWPGSVPYLMGRGIQPIACGQPVWGTLAEAARRAGYTDHQVEAMVAEIRRLREEA